MTDFEVSFDGPAIRAVRVGWPRSGPVVIGWPRHMPLPRAGEGVSIDTTSLLIHRGDGDWSVQSPRARRVNGVVESVRTVRTYDETQEQDRVKWFVEVTLL